MEAQPSEGSGVEEQPDAKRPRIDDTFTSEAQPEAASAADHPSSDDELALDDLVGGDSGIPMHPVPMPSCQFEYHSPASGRSHHHGTAHARDHSEEYARTDRRADGDE